MDLSTVVVMKTEYRRHLEERHGATVVVMKKSKGAFGIFRFCP